MRINACRTVAALAASLAALPAAAQTEEATAALPTISLTFAAHYVADELGLWEKNGLKVKTTVVAGVGAANAVLAGSVDFSMGSGPTVVRANARGQKLFAIGTTMDKPIPEVVLSKEVAAKRGIQESWTLAQKAEAVKGLTLAIDSPNTIPHGFMRYFLAKGKVNDQRDVTLTPMAPPSMPAALKSGAVAGYVMSQPWTLIPVREGVAVVLASAPRGDFPEMEPFSYNVIITRAGYCDQKPTICRKALAAYQDAVNVIRDEPDKALTALRKRFADMDPAILAESFAVARKVTPATTAIDPVALKNGQDLMVVTGMVKEEETLKSFDGIYSNKYRP